jgi:uncharacterized protein YqjF (DUF2071 family)
MELRDDFPSGITDHISHRPWSLPDGPWIMRQSWHDLLFAHWPVAVDEMRKLIPQGLELDLFDRQAWLGIIPFHMTNVAPRGVPALPFVSAFPELNVRTYVQEGGKPGVYFFSLDAGSALAASAGRTLFGLPYHTATMTVAVQACDVRYHSRRLAGTGPGAEFKARYRPVGPLSVAAPGTLEYFLTERYCLYTTDASSHMRRLEIHHLPWHLQMAEAEIETNTMATAAGLRLPSMAPRLHFTKRQDMIAWLPTAVR